jgi:Mg-chelatase subunit ChlD
MKVLVLVSFLFLSCLNLLAQKNLVLNASFENGEHKGRGSYNLKKGNELVKDWHSPIRYAPYLYITPKRSVAVANSGLGAVGLLLGSSRQEKTKLEYLTGKLASPLIKGQVYCICFNTVLQRTSRWAATDVGVLLHHDSKLLSKITDPATLTATLYADEGAPLTGTKWKKYCGYYKATGGEKFISFGKFGSSKSVAVTKFGIEPYFELDGFQSKAYYQFDDMVVKAITDTTDCGCAEKLPQADEDIVKPIIAPYLFALDASGSMKADALFDSLRVNLVKFINELPKGTPVSLVTFASSSRKIFSGVMGDNTAQTVDSLLKRAPVGGGTNVFVGLQLAYESWDSDRADSAKMVLVSDGEFHVSPKIAELIKNQYEAKGRKLTLIQIGARASGLEQVQPYMDSYIHTTASELSQVVSQLNRPKGVSGNAVTCECEEEFSDVMNYHFVIDYSGSMSDEKDKAIAALRYLFDKAPNNAMISITSFNQTSRELYVGKKTGITMSKLTMLLQGEQTGGGTNPAPGVQYALKIAEKMSANRFSHIILITDFSAQRMSRKEELAKSFQRSADRFDLLGSAITVDEQGLVETHSQFDLTSGTFLGVSRKKFEKDLFNTKRSSCDYTSQPYHFNPTKNVLKHRGKKFLSKILKNILDNNMN